MPKKRPAAAELSRLTVLAAGDERTFAAYAIELLRTNSRLTREAALTALADRPVAAARDALRELYFELDEDGAKRDQGAAMRVGIVRVLATIGDVRDTEIAVRATDAFEEILGDDVSWPLRVHGLRMLAHLSPEMFAYYAIEHLDDRTPLRSEPANTAFQLLAGRGNYAPIYQWLISGEREPEVVANAFEMLTDAPREILRRYVARVIEVAIRRNDEPMSTVLAETIVRLELEDAYPALGRMMSSKLSDELYNYLALLLAGTNRAPMLAILEQQLHSGRRPTIVVAALRVRTTPEQAAILRRWEE